MMKWRIEVGINRGFIAEYGFEHADGVEVGYKPGCTMPRFTIYFVAWFDTKEQAEAYIRENPNPMEVQQ